MATVRSERIVESVIAITNGDPDRSLGLLAHLLVVSKEVGQVPPQQRTTMLTEFDLGLRTGSVSLSGTEEEVKNMLKNRLIERRAEELK